MPITKRPGPGTSGRDAGGSLRQGEEDRSAHMLGETLGSMVRDIENLGRSMGSFTSALDVWWSGPSDKATVERMKAASASFSDELGKFVQKLGHYGELLEDVQLLPAAGRNEGGELPGAIAARLSKALGSASAPLNALLDASNELKAKLDEIEKSGKPGDAAYGRAAGKLVPKLSKALDGALEAMDAVVGSVGGS